MERFELVGGDFRAVVIDDFGLPHGHVLGPLFDNGREAWTFLEAIKPFIFESESYATRGLLASMARRIALYFYAKGVHSMPRSRAAWQSAITKIYTCHLEEYPYRPSLKTQMQQWQQCIAPILEFLRDVVKLIPAGVEVPPKKRVRAKHIPDFKVQKTLADGETKGIKTAAEVSEQSALLLNLDLSRTDAEYLENYRDRLISARAALDADCVAYITSMSEHFEYGQRLLKMFSEAAADRFEAKYLGMGTRKLGDPYHEMRMHLEPDNYPGETEISLARILRFFLRAAPHSKQKTIFTKSPWLPSWQSVRFPGSAPQAPHEELNSDTRRFRWMLGLVDVADLSIIHMLLTIRNPKFNALPLFNATLSDKRNRSHFTMVVDGVSFSVDKRRAKARKASTLDAESVLAIDTVLKMTKTVRDSMANSNPLKNKLFMSSTYVGPKGFKYPSLYSFNADRRAIRYFLPRTAALEMPPEHINALRLRRTAAVLEWFATGSVLAAARKLGNTRRIIIKHYIPEHLIMAWNTRLVRRFQNILLASAAANEPYLLGATDFSTPTELKKFIEDMLKQHAPSSSKLAAAMHGRFRNPDIFAGPDEQADATNPSGIVVGISATTLAVLYAYRNLAYERGVEAMAGASKASNQIAPAAIVDLADLLNTRLPDHHDPRFKAAHREAELLAPHIIADMQEGTFAVIERRA